MMFTSRKRTGWASALMTRANPSAPASVSVDDVNRSLCRASMSSTIRIILTVVDSKFIVSTSVEMTPIKSSTRRIHDDFGPGDIWIVRQHGMRK